MLGSRTIYDVVSELIGDIKPEADEALDRRAEVHLMTEIDLVNLLLDDIEEVASMNMTQDSAHRIIMRARGAMQDWGKWLTERSEEL